MLKNSGPPTRPDVQHAVEQILKADRDFDRYENRTAHRQHLVRAVELELRETGSTEYAFSRNISATGIGVISLTRFDVDSVAVLSIAALDSEDTQFLAECRWCKEFGPKWFLSGWQFIGLKRK